MSKKTRLLAGAALTSVGVLAVLAIQTRTAGQAVPRDPSPPLRVVSRLAAASFLNCSAGWFMSTRTSTMRRASGRTARRARKCASASFLRLERERRAVHAVPEARGARTVFEDVSKMAAASRAVHLGPHHPKLPVD